MAVLVLYGYVGLSGSGLVRTLSPTQTLVVEHWYINVFSPITNLVLASFVIVRKRRELVSTLPCDISIKNEFFLKINAVSTKGKKFPKDKPFLCQREHERSASSLLWFLSPLRLHMATKNRQQLSLAASLGNNIMSTCSCLSSAVREYYQLPEADQRQVWDDLTKVDVGVECHVSGRIDDKSLVAAWKDKYEPRQMVEEALQKMAAELERMPPSHKKDALELALRQNEVYVNAKVFRLKFLRAEKFDVFAAAVRLCRHFEEKLQLFGEETLTREISIEDIIANEDDKDALYRGYLQVLEDTDQGNRPILFYFKAITNCYRKR